MSLDKLVWAYIPCFPIKDDTLEAHNENSHKL